MVSFVINLLVTASAIWSSVYIIYETTFDEYVNILEKNPFENFIDALIDKPFFPKHLLNILITYKIFQYFASSNYIVKIIFTSQQRPKYRGFDKQRSFKCFKTFNNDIRI